MGGHEGTGLFQLLWSGVLDGDVVAVDDEGLGESAPFGIIHHGFEENRRRLARVAAVDATLGAGELEGDHGIQLFRSLHDAGDHMFDAGVTGHEDRVFIPQCPENIAAVEQAYGRPVAEFFPDMIRHVVKKRSIHTYPVNGLCIPR